MTTRPMALKRNKRKPYTLDKLMLSLSTAVRELEAVYLNRDNDVDQRVRAINSLASLANSYSRLTEVHELESKMNSIEERLNNGEFK